MKIKLIAVGSKMPQWIEQGYQQYAKRLNQEFKPELIEIQPNKRLKKSDTDKIKQKEGELILQHLHPKDWVIALDVKGQQWDTQQLASQFNNWQQQAKNLAFIIGGPEGLSKECLHQSDQTWSLSNLTFPHPLVRILWAEAIYRAWSLHKGHPYHRE